VATPDEAPRATARAYLRLVLIAGAVGVPAALVAAVFLALVHDLEGWLWDEDPAWYLVIGLPVLGACIVLAARTLLPGDGGHSPLLGLGGGTTPLSHAPGVALAALGTLPFGAVLGPEAPVIALGSAVGMAVVPYVRLDERASRVLANAGSFSAISALFGGPIVAGLLLVEGGLAAGTALLPMLVPGLVAAAVGYLVFIGFGDWGGLGTAGLTVPGLTPYDGVHLGDLLVAIAVGVVAALTLAAIKLTATRVGGFGIGLAPLLLGGGLAVGVLAEVASLLGADANEILFSGQSAIPEVVAESSTGVVLVILVAKGLAYAISLGCGFRGGPIFPAIFLAIGLASLPVVWFDVSPTLAIAVGAAAGMAAQARLLVAPTLFASLLVGHAGADTVTAIVLASVAAWLTATALERRAAAATGSPSPA
jgi:H+/Cl- antiporter ClcA